MLTKYTQVAATLACIYTSVYFLFFFFLQKRLREDDDDDDEIDTANVTLTGYRSLTVI